MEAATMLRELAPTVEQLMQRHLATTKEWFPHELIPYGRGRDFDADEAWCESSSDLGGSTIDEAVRSSLIVNLLTEDNLPYYFRTIERELGADGPWGAWSMRWSCSVAPASICAHVPRAGARQTSPRACRRSSRTLLRRQHEAPTGSAA